MDFSSDNAYGAWPQIVEAIARAASGPARSYGADAPSGDLRARFCDLFEREVAVFPVISGTAANALALATLVPPHGAILCHGESHIAVDECGAPEFFTHGAKLATVEGDGAKLTPAAVEGALQHFQKGFVHHAQPSCISLTQSTERGTVYTQTEIAELAALARAHGMSVHMDGARFANALVHLGCTPAEASWKAGVDVLSFGATKNGALGAEAVIFFEPQKAGDFPYRRKKAGHLISKMRFVSAQLLAYLEGGRWLEHARRANLLAARLGEGLSAVRGVRLAHPVEANAVFAYLPDSLAGRLRENGAQFYDWAPPSDGQRLVRLVTSSLMPVEDVENFLRIANSE